MEVVTNNNFSFLIKEYEKLKDEQRKRIEFRDQMVYLTLGVVGTVFSFAVEKPDLTSAYLVLPFICMILGWTYLVNDEKITSIATYVRKGLIPKLDQLSRDKNDALAETWEDFRRSDSLRKQRKWLQLIVDLSLFCLSGAFSIIAFLIFSKNLSWYHIVIMVFEGQFILYLSFQFYRYADLWERENSFVTN